MSTTTTNKIERDALAAYYARKAADARRGFEAYNQRVTDSLEADAHTAISDLIGDLLHLAVEHGAEPTQVLASAERHFAAERQPDDLTLVSALEDLR